jgi:hypothetical protein
VCHTFDVGSVEQGSDVDQRQLVQVGRADHGW